MSGQRNPSRQAPVDERPQVGLAVATGALPLPGATRHRVVTSATAGDRRVRFANAGRAGPHWPLTGPDDGPNGRRRTRDLTGRS
ncbi:hypothetical protein LX15_002540 [Streptoalloteichus tenebrarius]|uniref:Uncharacterized protein n=1 Tax=Streptoalloteichus tenebrarius (strain ATCC 17920 / DSM 40477 / JCM 4838 / CBS 697.72 / NBRC 16177 / NCIMB 11028 / NRRL B-12390 / A12253. 1 / ISP 5477) TaxID=1933 RepID=A0ABT1HTI3_STRSD|nr:hypothetical protein [Streptoalloteichus tenebrarius]MCP2258842.1 hypothetical protein [Streptoalloteichus tenebrarius]BFE99473.1 hypothetical protein GCM10020241_11490 [Streptoalloteichus tenebrarius]